MSRACDLDLEGMMGFHGEGVSATGEGHGSDNSSYYAMSFLRPLLFFCLAMPAGLERVEQVLAYPF